MKEMVKSDLLQEQKTLDELWGALPDYEPALDVIDFWLDSLELAVDPSIIYYVDSSMTVDLYVSKMSESELFGRYLPALRRMLADEGIPFKTLERSDVGTYLVYRFLVWVGEDREIKIEIKVFDSPDCEVVYRDVLVKKAYLKCKEGGDYERPEEDKEVDEGQPD